MTFVVFVFSFCVSTVAMAGEWVLGNRSGADAVADKVSDPDVDLSEPDSVADVCLAEKLVTGMEWESATAECKT